MQLIPQSKHFSCGSAAYSMLVGCTEKEAIAECKTRHTGTATYNIVAALNKRGIKNYLINLNIDLIEYGRWLLLNSNKQKLYLSCVLVSNWAKRGRNQNRHHAICCYNGIMYDPSEREPLPIEAYFSVFNKNLIIKQMVIVPDE